jgi:hypothetical protein
MTKKNVRMQPLYLSLVFRTNQMFMKKFLVIVLAWFSLTVHAQQTETRNIGSFTGVKAAEGIDVYLKKGDKESVRVEVTGTSPSNILTEISGSYLKVHMRDGNFRGRIDAKVYVTYVKVEKLSASSAGSIFSDGVIKATDMEISASSAGTIEVSVEAQTIEVSSSSAGDVELKGRARSLRADAASAGEIDADELEAEEVEAEAGSGGSAKVYVTKSLEAHASSGGGIRWRGNPDRNNTSSSSGGSVKKSN